MRARIPQVNNGQLFEKVGNVTIPIYPTNSKGYDGFTVAWYEGTKRLRKFFAREADARTHAKLVARKTHDQERLVVALSPEDSRIYVDALTRLKPLRMTLDAAVRELVAAHEIIGGHPLIDAVKFWKRHNGETISEKRVSEVVDEMVRGLRDDGATTGHIKEMERSLGKFATSFQTNISNISTVEINTYLRDLSVAPGSRNIYRQKIVTLFNYARKSGYLADITTAATKSSKAKEPSQEIEIYSVEEMTRMLLHSSPALRPFIVLSGFCGLRSAEAMRLDWKEIDFEKGTVLVPAKKSKTQSRRFAPLPENAAAWLRPHAKPSGQVVTVVMIVNALRRLGPRARVEMKRNGLRHSFCSYRLTATQNADQTALEAGHSAIVLFKHYRQLCTESDAARWFSILPEGVADPDSATGRCLPA